jgi:hypothetical protein
MEDEQASRAGRAIQHRRSHGDDLLVLTTDQFEVRLVRRDCVVSGGQSGFTCDKLKGNIDVKWRMVVNLRSAQRCQREYEEGGCCCEARRWAHRDSPSPRRACPAEVRQRHDSWTVNFKVWLGIVLSMSRSGAIGLEPGTSCSRSSLTSFDAPRFSAFVDEVVRSCSVIT